MSSRNAIQNSATYYYQEGTGKIECAVTKENDGLTIKAINGPQVRLEMQEAGSGVARIKSRIDRRNGQWAEGQRRLSPNENIKWLPNCAWIA